MSGIWGAMAVAGAFVNGFCSRLAIAPEEPAPASGPMTSLDVLAALESLGIEILPVDRTRFAVKVPENVMTPGIEQVIGYHASNLLALVHERKGPDRNDFDYRLLSVDGITHAVELYAEPTTMGLHITSKIYRLREGQIAERVDEHP